MVRRGITLNAPKRHQSDWFERNKWHRTCPVSVKLSKSKKPVSLNSNNCNQRDRSLSNNLYWTRQKLKKWMAYKINIHWTCTKAKRIHIKRSNTNRKKCPPEWWAGRPGVHAVEVNKVTGSHGIFIWRRNQAAKIKLL